jgi:hypothetical protein
MATSFKGGWRNPLLTVNLMEDLKAQPSLTQGLRLGAVMAHRQTCMDVRTGDARNARRANPAGNKARVGGK